MSFHDISISTDRLEIRPLSIDDYSNWLYGFKQRKVKQNEFDAEYLDVSNWDIHFFRQTVDSLNTLASKDEAYIFGIFIKHTGEHIGKLEFTVLQRNRFQWCMIGYHIHNQYWNKGYASESLRTVDNIAEQLGLHRIEAHIHPNNIQSIKVIEKK